MAIDVGLFLVFLALKLSGHIDWSWWFVFSPLIVSFFIGVFIVLIKEIYS